MEILERDGTTKKGEPLPSTSIQTAAFEGTGKDFKNSRKLPKLNKQYRAADCKADKSRSEEPTKLELMAEPGFAGTETV